MFGSFFEQDHLLYLFILGVHAKRWSKCAQKYNTKADVARNLIDNFFLTLTVRGPFHRKDFKWKNDGVAGLISEKTDFLYAELYERAEAATGSYSVTGDSLQYTCSVPVSKNHRSIRSRCLVFEFSFTDIF